MVGKITINYADAVSNVEKVSKAAKDTAESLEDVDKKADDAGDSVEDAGQSAKNADSGFSTWKATLANLASTAITNVISKCTELAGKMAEVTRSAVGHYAEYEQLVGGVETLFKDSSGKLIGYAEKAYKTAGMSSNQYMDTATSFAASLIQGLGGDTAKAVELTNLAITDMSDNANKMGTDIGSIQDAYQGFAKQNYTMLDNLKLGYGGTQSEMIRLINDSGVLGEKIESLDNVTFDQMIEAIHKIQDNLGITGTTAEEAGTTISGSWGSVQALFENILTKVGSKLAPTVMGFLQQLSDWMEEVDWDAFASSVGDALQKVFDWIQQIDFKSFFEKGMDGVEKFLEKLGEFIPKVIEVIQNIQGFIDIIVALSPVILGVATTVGTLAAAFKFKEIIDGVKTAMTGLFAAMSANPIVAVIAIIAGLVVALVTLWNTNEDFRNAVISIWEAVKSAFSTAIEAIKGFFQSMVEKITTAWENIKNAFNTALNVIKTVMSAIQSTITTIWNAIKTVVTNVVNAIKSVISNVFNAIKSTISNILNGIKSVFSSVWNGIKTTVSNVVNGIKTVISNGLNGAKSVVSNVLGAIKEKFSSIFNGAKDIVKGAIDKIKGFFNFSWSLPKLKMPHPTISGSFSLNPPSVPHFGIEWYKKAMDDGMIMNQPTIFGYNPKNNQFLAGGEAGSETVVGTDSLMTMINSAVSQNNAEVVNEINSMHIDLNRLIEFLFELLPSSSTVVLDSGVLVGELAPAMDEELGRIYARNAR